MRNLIALFACSFVIATASANDPPAATHPFASAAAVTADDGLGAALAGEVLGAEARGIAVGRRPHVRARDQRGDAARG